MYEEKIVVSMDDYKKEDWLTVSDPIDGKTEVFPLELIEKLANGQLKIGEEHNNVIRAVLKDWLFLNS